MNYHRIALDGIRLVCVIRLAWVALTPTYEHWGRWDSWVWPIGVIAFTWWIAHQFNVAMRIGIFTYRMLSRLRERNDSIDLRIAQAMLVRRYGEWLGSYPHTFTAERTKEE